MLASLIAVCSKCQEHKEQANSEWGIIWQRHVEKVPAGN